MESAQDKLADCFADGNHAVPQGVSHLHLRNAATCRGGSEVGKADPGNQAANGRGKDGPTYPAMPRSGVGALNEQGLKPHDAQVECHGSQPADPTGHNGHRQQALPLAGHPAQQPSVETCI